MSYFASSAAPDIAHWHAEKPIHLMQEMRDGIEAWIESAIQEAREVIVWAEYNLTQLADELGIKHFGHQISCDLTGCRLVLQPHGHLEIHREGARHMTSFPVAMTESEIVGA